MPAKNSVIGSEIIREIRRSKKEKKEFTTGGSGFPNGIDFGKAKVNMIKAAKYETGINKGKPYYMVRGVCVSPKSIANKGEVIDTEGLSDTIVMEPLFETPTRSRKTLKDHVDYMNWTLMEMGVDLDEVDENDYENLFQALLETGPVVKFRTWQSKPTEEYPNPRVNVQFTGGSSINNNEDNGDDIVDNTDDSDSEEEIDIAPHSNQDDDKEKVTATFDGDLDSLASDADEEDEDAQVYLEDLAKKSGLPSKAIEDAQSWRDLAELIKNSLEKEKERADRILQQEEKDEIDPQKGEVYSYKPPRGKKALECEVLKVNKRSKKVDLKHSAGDLEDILYENVSWEKLS